MSRFSEFNPSAVGPVEAQRRYNDAFWKHRSNPTYLEEQRKRVREHQHTLFDPDSLPLPPPHTQTRTQFGNRSDVFFHGTYKARLPTKGTDKSGGIHVGSVGAANARRRALGPGRKGEPWRVIPVILRGEHENIPETAGQDQGERWVRSGGIHYYRNDVEDRGSISAVVPNKSHLLTHPQAIREAKKAGLSVHPMVEWESKHLGHEGDPGRTVLGRQWAPSTYTQPMLPVEMPVQAPGVYARGVAQKRQKQLQDEAVTQIKAQGGNPFPETPLGWE